MAGLATLSSGANLVVNFAELTLIEDTLKQVIRADKGRIEEHVNHDQIDVLDTTTMDQTPNCPDLGHQVSLIDIAGDEAAAIVEFTNCAGASFTDLYVLHKQDDAWTVDSKVWDSHAFN